MNNVIDGVELLSYFRMQDNRGVFEKPVSNLPINFNGFNGLQEMFTSTSGVNVWRGFHLQTGKDASNRIIYCAAGKADDYLIDLRKNSATFQKIQKFEFDHQSSPKILFVPAGVAHGFFSKTEGTVIVYLSDKAYAPESDTGVNLHSVLNTKESFGIEKPFMSERDSCLPELDDYLSINYTYG